MLNPSQKAMIRAAIGLTVVLLGVASITRVSLRVPRMPAEDPSQAAQAAMALSHLPAELQQLN
jgi:hypothetical protein